MCRSLLCLLCLVPSGCLISDPPDLQEPTQTTPVLDALRADPAVTAIIPLRTGEPEAFSVPFRSEDAGEEVLAILFFNFGVTDRQSLAWHDTLPPSTFDDDQRTISFSLTVRPPVQPGCNQLSLIVTHASNVERVTNRILEPQRAGMLTWWANVDASSDALNDCPSNTQPDGDAGSNP